jgi:hypothetical protein
LRDWDLAFDAGELGLIVILFTRCEGVRECEGAKRGCKRGAKGGASECSKKQGLTFSIEVREVFLAFLSMLMSKMSCSKSFC